MDKFTDRIFEIDLEAKQIIAQSEQHRDGLDKRVSEELEAFRRELQARIKEQSKNDAERERADCGRKTEEAQKRYSSFESAFRAALSELREQWTEDVYRSVIDSLN